MAKLSLPESKSFDSVRLWARAPPWTSIMDSSSKGERGRGGVKASAMMAQSEVKHRGCLLSWSALHAQYAHIRGRYSLSFKLHL